jgi:transketolase
MSNFPAQEFKLRLASIGNSRIWARMGIRAFYGSALFELRSLEPNLVALSSDLGRSSGLQKFSSTFPESYFNVGIAEQTLVALGSGLASGGHHVFASTFAPFATSRAAEFVRLEMGYMGMPLNLVGLGSGVSLGYLGNSHYGLEDIALIHSIPGIRIFSPADATELALCLIESITSRAPTYLRLTGGPGSPALLNQELPSYNFEPFRLLRRVHGDRLIVTSGALSGVVSELLSEDDGKLSDLSHIHVGQLRPLDSALYDVLSAFKEIYVADEHLQFGGLASILEDGAPAQVNWQNRFRKRNLGKAFLEQGSYEDVLASAGLDKSGLKEFLIR